MMVSLTIFQNVADSPTLTTLAVIAEVLSVSVMLGVKSNAVDTFGAGPCPDLWFGIAPPRLHTFFDRLGDEGREAYSAVNRWDLFPYMISYTILLGSLLVRVARRAGVGEGIAHVMPVVLCCDFVETIILKRACDLFPELLDGRVVAIGSIANQIKWILFALSLGILAVLFAAGKNETTRKRQNKAVESNEKSK
uniref:Uncharacterized protein n=1 Tax=Attheya septentrionalis TaxID=420275 RepID=A0A7S2XP79_9STRA|mmetsp:Transcript_17713/g.32019  ORF Transcript_17713/g.32019 Transcript_17713/m.32019 type:complete len:194 (+) Transcript_17713:66-647(+)